MASCVFAPEKGNETFYKLKKELGYKQAWEVYGISISNRFLNDYKNTLRLDSEGVPTFDSLMKNQYIQKIIGNNKTISLLEKNFQQRPDTLNDYALSLKDALDFNKNGNKKFVAIVESNEGKLDIKVKPVTKSNLTIAANQQATYSLNKSISNILSPLGISLGDLTKAEMNAGRVGVIDFSDARKIASDIISMIRVANDSRGAVAISEEFSHLIIGAMHNEPIIQRAINSLANDEKSLRTILGDSDYEDTKEFYSNKENANQLIAEEALGHLLRDELNKQSTILPTLKNGGNVIKRAFNYIVNKFKRINPDNVNNAITNARTVMSDLANSILTSKTSITKSDIINSERNVSFNSLDENVERDMKILRDAIDTEAKRYKISGARDDKDTSNSIKQNINALNGKIAAKQTAEGVLMYAHQALSDLDGAYGSLVNFNNSKDGKGKTTVVQPFKMLRGVKATIDSYGKFINDLNDVYNEDSGSQDVSKNITIDTPEGHVVLNMADTVEKLNNINNRVTRLYLKSVIPAFAEFIKPILGDKVTDLLKDKAGNKISVEQLLRTSESDISYLDMWLDTMADSSDVLLQTFDEVYKKAVDAARLKSIDEFKEIQALRQEAESKGISSYDWMFEKYSDGKKTGNYISEINYGQFKKDLKEEMDYLDNKYGKNPKGNELIEKNKERNSWIKIHASFDITNRLIPGTFYLNHSYRNLSSAQREVLDKFLDFKERHDQLYSGENPTLKAIQIRKDSIQRIGDVKSVGDLWNNVKAGVERSLLDRADDDSMFGAASTRTGLTDFTGKSFMVLPKLFTSELEDGNELSTDIFNTLMQYTYATNNYEQLNKIVDPLEVGRNIVHDIREVKDTVDGNPIKEKFKSLGVSVENNIFKRKGTNIEKRLDDFMESQIYHKYLKDSGSFNVFGIKVNKNKATNLFLGISSMAQLGLNYLANMANMTTGVCMQNIEAAAGEFFSAKELALADKEYSSLLLPYMAEINSRNKTGRLALFDDLFDIRQRFDSQIHDTQRKNWLARIFGSDIAFIGQEAGDHWMYNRTAIAMARHEKLNVPGKGVISLWDALQIRNKFQGNSTIKEMIIPEGTTTMDGKAFDIHAFTRKVGHVNQSLFGIYNTEDRNAAHRVIVGKMVMQYRNWMKPQFNKRFQKSQINVATGQVEEGYYRTFFNMINELRRGKVQLAEQWGNMTPHERANVKRSLAEIAQFMAIWALANFVEWPDDKHRPWAEKLAEYSCKRLVHDLGNLTPSTTMVNELLKTVQSPAASISIAGNLMSLIGSVIDPRDYVNEISSGPYKGMSTLERNLYRAPIPGLMQYKQVDRVFNQIDNSINFYARPYSY